MTKGLKDGGTVLALGVDRGVLGDKADKFSFVALDPYIKGGIPADIKSGIIACLESQKAF